MTDEEFVFNSTVAERSVLKNSAQHKKGGAATAKLGNRKASWQEIRGKHGEVKTYSLDSMMDFATFREMQPDLQVEYINKLQDKYDINLHHISNYLFHVGDDGLQGYLRINGILNQCNPDKRRAKTGLVQFQNDIEESKRQKTAPPEAQKPEERVPLGELMEYEEYFALSPEGKAEWLNSIVDKYDVGLNNISIVLFKKSKALLSVQNKTLGINDKVKNPKRKGTEACRETIARFEKAVAQWRSGKEPEEAKEGTPEAPEPEICEAEVSKEEPQKANLVVLETKDEAAKERSAEEKKEPAYETIFKSSFVGAGEELARLKALAELFSGKTVRVNIEIVELAPEAAEQEAAFGCEGFKKAS